MTFDELKSKYPDRDASFPDGKPKPNQENLNLIMEEYGCSYPKSFIDFQLIRCHGIPMGDFAWDGFGWANKDLPPDMNLEKIVRDFKELNFPNYLTPFREENGDFWCFDTRTQDQEFPVVIWDHNSNDIEKDPEFQWKSFIDWLDKTMEEE